MLNLINLDRWESFKAKMLNIQIYSSPPNGKYSHLIGWEESIRSFLFTIICYYNAITMLP